MRKRRRAGWGVVVVLGLTLVLFVTGAAWAGPSGLRSFSALGQSHGVRIASPGDSENGLIYIHDVTLYSCEPGYIQVTIQADYDFPTPPHVRVVESANGTEVGSTEGGEADTFFADTPQTNKETILTSDYATGITDTNFTYSWDILFLVDEAPVAEWVVEGDCNAETAMATEIYPAPTLPGPAVLGAALLLLGIGIATLRSRG